LHGHTKVYNCMLRYMQVHTGTHRELRLPGSYIQVYILFSPTCTALNHHFEYTKVGIYVYILVHLSTYLTCFGVCATRLIRTKALDWPMQKDIRIVTAIIRLDTRLLLAN
jgi:hypothetical protein